MLIRNSIPCTAPVGSSSHKLLGPAHKADHCGYQSEVGCCNIYAPSKAALRAVAVVVVKEEVKKAPDLTRRSSLSFPLTKLQHTTSAGLLFFAVLVVTTKVLNKTI